MKLILSVVTLTVLGLFAGPSNADVRLFSDSYKIGIVANQPLGKKHTPNFRRFKAERSYFGAFFVDTTADVSYWVNNFHDMKKAKRAAHKGCDLLSKDTAHSIHGPSKCRLYAVSYPKEVDPNGRNLSGMGRWALRVFNDTYKARRTAQGYGAFALSNASHFGYTYGWNDSEEAKDQALAHCAAAVAKEMAGLTKEGRRWAHANGLNKCRIVDTQQPDPN